MNRPNTREIQALSGLVVIAAVFRVHRLGSWPLFGDEVNTVIESRGFSLFSDPSGAYEWTHLTNALSHWLTGLVYQAFGESLLTARLIPCLFGLLAIPVFYFLIRSLFQTRVALLCVFLMTISPNLIFLSGFARYNSMLFFFGGLAFFLLLTGLLRNKPLHLFLGLMSLLLAVWTHVTAALVLVAFLVLSMLFAFQKGVKKRGIINAIIIVSIPCGVIALIFREEVFWILEVVLGDFKGAPAGYPPLRLMGSLAYNDGMVNALFAIFAVCYAVKSRDRLSMAVTVYWGLPFATVVIGGFWYAVGPRYLHSVLPGFYLLAAVGLDRWWSALGSNRPTGKIVLIAFVLATQAPLLASNWRDGGRYDTWSATQFLLACHEANPREPIIAEGHLIYEYHSGGALEVLELPSNLEELLALLEGAETALIVFPLQRGTPLGFWSQAYHRWLNLNCRILKSISTTRYDLMRYEIAVYRYSRGSPASK